MPKLPIVSGRAIVKALERLGFVAMRQRGSHVVMRRGASGCVVPLHNEVRKGTLGTIIKQADITAEDLIEALR